MRQVVRRGNAWNADLHVPIHTNSYNGTVSGTRVFCFNENGEGYKAAKCVFDALAPITPGTSENLSVNRNLYEVSYANAPTVYVEAEFHDVAACAKWIIENVGAIGEAIAEGICNYYGVSYVTPFAEKYSVVIGECGTQFEAEAKLDKIKALISTAESALVTLNAMMQDAKIIKR